MSMRKVAQLAGVSTSTVSRVVNDRPNVAAGTVASVQRAMRQLSFAPTIRRNVNGNASRNPALKTASVAFLVFGTSGTRTAPAFDRLLRGVSGASAGSDLSLIFSFVSDPNDPLQLPRNVAERRVDGLLLHGERPGPRVQARLENLPTVWLMANREKPLWGDQVMPDNTAIGETAAQYLLRRGHRQLAYLGTRSGAWYLPIRSLAFVKSASDVGAEAHVLEAAEQRADGDFWERDGLLEAAQSLVQRLIDLSPRPTGIFIAEDRLVPAIDAALHLHGVRAAPGQGLELVTCNNERPHLSGLWSSPATIDIRAESIGRRGVEHLLWRLRNPDVPERVRSMVEPVLLEPAAAAAAPLVDRIVLESSSSNMNGESLSPPPDAPPSPGHLWRES